MSSGRSETPTHPASASRRAAAAAAVLIASTAIPLPAAAPWAGEATGRGRKAEIVWIDADGERHEEVGRLIRYGYYRRVFLSVPREGRSYKDDERKVKGLPFSGDFLSFPRIDVVEFEYHPSGHEGEQGLVLNVRLLKGAPKRKEGTTLAGAQHPESPWISFTVDGEEHQVEVHPLASREEMEGRARILSMRFIL